MMQVEIVKGAPGGHMPVGNETRERTWGFRKTKKTAPVSKVPTKGEEVTPGKWLKIRNAIAHPLVEYGCPFFLCALVCAAIAGVASAIVGSVGVGLFVLLGAAGVGGLAYLLGCALEKKTD